MTRTIISDTGEIHGRGSDPHKWVSYLADHERAHVRTGGLVLIRDNNPHPMCCGWKAVEWSVEYGYSHREATPDEIASRKGATQC